MLQRLTGCPRYTFTKEALWSLSEFGMKNRFNSIRVSNTAAMIRMALQTATSFTKMKTLFDDALNGDRCMMLSLVSGETTSFDMPAIVNTLQKAIDCAFLHDIHHTAWKLHLRSALANASNVQLQAVISKYLGTVTSDFNARVFLSRRMARWLPSVSDLGKTWWGFVGAFVMQLCQFELLGAPQCVIATYIKKILNGWASTRRLKLHPVQCVFGCGSRQDCIEHYMECRHVEAIWDRVASGEWGSFESRLAVGCADIRGRILRVFFIYGIFSAYNKIRHGNICGNVAESCANLVRSKIIYALGRSFPNVRHLHAGSETQTAKPRHSIDDKRVGEAIFNFRKRLQLSQPGPSTKRGRWNGPKKTCR